MEPNLLERNSQEVVPLFLSLLPEKAVRNETEISELDDSYVTWTGQARRTLIMSYLRIFAKVKNPSRMHSTDQLNSSFLSLLSNGESRLQQLSLECVLTWADKGTKGHAQLLRDLAEDEKFSDALSSLDVETFRAETGAEDRSQFVMVLSRVLYGKLVSRSGRNSSKYGLKARRKAIFAFLSNMGEDIICTINLMLEPFEFLRHLSGEEQSLSVGRRFQVGFLHMLEDCISQLRSRLTPFLPQLLRVLVRLPTLNTAEGPKGEDIELTEDEGPSVKSGTDKELKTLCIQRWNELFSFEFDFDFSPYMEQLYKTLIEDKIPKFHTENTQAPSALMHLFSTWAHNSRYMLYLFRFSNELMENVVSIISAKKVKDSVLGFVLTMIESIQTCANEELDPECMAGYKHIFPLVIKNLRILFTNAIAEMTPNSRISNLDLQLQGIRILSNGAKLVEHSSDAVDIIMLLLPFLRKPAKKISEKVKLEILAVLANFVDIIPEIKTDLFHSAYFGTISQLYSTLTDRQARAQLQEVMNQFTRYEPELVIVHSLLEDWNSFDPRKVEEPDFRRQFDAFTKLNQELYNKLTPDQWLPILYQMIYNIQSDEFATRTSASYSIQLLIKVAAEDEDKMQERQRSFRDLIDHVLLPALKAGLRRNPEAVRSELLTLIGFMVRHLPTHHQFCDMVPLLGGENEESNFFDNIYHLQAHRRVKALRDLASYCDNGELKSSSVSNIFIPVLSHFIFESDRIADHNLINETIKSIGSCSGRQSWGHYQALLKRILNALPRRPELEKVLIRIVVQILEKFHFDVSDEPVLDVKPIEEIVTPDTAPVEDDDEEEAVPAVEVSHTKTVSTAVVNKLLPSLYALLPDKDDEKVPARVPIALAIAKLLKHFPHHVFMDQIPRLLTKLANMLRSHLQDSRDSTREILISITLLWGPESMDTVLKQLQTALTRGYQLHVLAYTLHALLSQMTPLCKPGDLDSGVGMIANICIEDIFGFTAQEKEVQELRGKMKEMKASKSYDTLEMLSKIIGLGSLAKLLLPIKEIMMEISDSKSALNLKEVFRRIAVGLSGNSGVECVDLLTFVHELVTENLSVLQSSDKPKKRLSNYEKNYRVQMKRNDAVEPMKNFTANSHMFIEFGLSILLTFLKSNSLDLRSPETQQLLEPFVEILGSALYSAHDAITIQSLRVFSLIIKLPMDKIKEATPVILKKLFAVIRKSSSLDSELTQVSFRLLTIIIRDCQSIDLSQKQLTTLLALIRPDLEEPDRQAVVFSMTRAILSRKYVANEIYDLMEDIARIMVTNQTVTIRNLCRQSFMQFLLDYPHGQAKLRQHVNFVVKGLEYEHESGRITILEVFQDMITHFSEEVLDGFSEMMFMALVLNLVNDDSPKCRELTGVVITSLFGKIKIERISKLIILLNSWFESTEKQTLQRMAAQVYGLLIDSMETKSERWVPSVIMHIDTILTTFSQNWAVKSKDENMAEDEITADWELAYYCLNTLSKIATRFPNSFSDNHLWHAVSDLLNYPHGWIKALTCRLLGQVLTSIDSRTRVIANISDLNAKPQILLEDEGSVRKLAGRLCAQLDSDKLTQSHALQIVKNLNFLGKCLVPFLECGNEESDSDAEIEEVDATQNSKQSSSLLWLTKKLAFRARSEAAKSRGPLIVRFKVKVISNTYSDKQSFNGSQPFTAASRSTLLNRSWKP